MGFSSIVERRVLPALAKLEGVDRIHIATSRSGLEVDIPAVKRGEIVTGYEEALDKIGPCLAYVSLPNHLHGFWVKEALRRDFHVVVDKPAFLAEEDLIEALSISEERDLCLAEAVVWPYHEQVTRLMERMSSQCAEISAMQAVFSFPPLANANFRNDPARGGGALNDLAAYAITPGRVFYGEQPEEVACRILSRNAAIDTGFSFEAFFSRGRVFQGFYSFTTEYRNSMLLLGDGFSAELNPAFTIGPSAGTTVVVRSKNQIEQLAVQGSDMFEVFLESVVSSLSSGNYGEWRNLLRRDAEIYFRTMRIAGAMK